jgi:predicted anti-sigma-YlaC factor YlaD
LFPDRTFPVPDPTGAAPRRAVCRLFLLGLLMPLLLGGCSLRQFAVDRAGDAIAEGGSGFASDEDPRLVRDAAPFSLKTIESLLEASPRNPKLLLAAARGFTQYAYAFVQQDADRLEERDVKAFAGEAERTRKLYRRARGYGLRGLDVLHPGAAARLRTDPAAALKDFRPADVPMLYWTAAAWSAEIALSKAIPDVVADLPAALALADRAAALDEGWNEGAIPALMISLEPVRPGGAADATRRADARYRRALELSGGAQAGPHVAWAESVALPAPDRAGFERALRAALAIDPDAVPRHRLANLVLQERARWLLSRTNDLFLE